MGPKLWSGGAGFVAGVALTMAIISLWRSPAEENTQRDVKVASPESESRADEPQAAPAEPAEPDVKADLANAIKAIESSDYLTYIEMYESIERLRELREKGLVESVARAMARNPVNSKFLAALKEMEKQEPKIDSVRGVATFEFDLPADEPVRSADPKEVRGPKAPPGFGSDLSKVIVEAEKTLAAKEYEKFVNAMLPPLVAGHFDPYRTRSLVETLRTDPQMVKRMSDDLKAMKERQPELSDDGATASFKLGEKPPGTKGATTADVERVIKFSLIDGDWRFFSEAARVTGHLIDFGNRRARDAHVTIRMERIGGNWRLLPFDL